MRSSSLLGPHQPHLLDKLILWLGAFMCCASFAVAAGDLQVPTLLAKGNLFIATAAVGDFNGDNKLDVVYVSGANVIVLLNNGSGAFAAPISSPGASGFDGIAVGDFDGDGKLDVAVSAFMAASGEYGMSVLLGKGNGSFAAPIFTPIIVNGTGTTPSNVLFAADFNNDGKQDLALAGSDQDVLPGRIYLSNGDGTFRLASSPDFGGSLAIGFAAADLNQDGKLDLVASVEHFSRPPSVGNPTANVSVALGNGDGTFQAPIGYVAAFSVTPPQIRDIDGDGRLDLAVLDGDGLEFLKGNGDGSFQPKLISPISINTAPQGIVLADVDGDGKLDVLASGGITNSSGATTTDVLVFAPGSGDGTFGNAMVRGFLRVDHLAVADLNGDGTPDLLARSPQTSLPDAFPSPSDSVIAFFNCTSSCTQIALTSPGIGTQVNFGTPVTLRVTVMARNSPLVPTGTVAFRDMNAPQNTVLGNGTLSSGAASLTLANLPVKTYGVIAAYSGDINFTPNVTGNWNSPTLQLTVVPAPTTTTITVSPTSAAPGQSVTIKAQVTSATGLIPTGSVTLSDGTTGLVTMQLDSSGSASHTTSSLSSGHHSLTWMYPGTTSFSPSLSSLFDLFVGPPDFSIGGATSRSINAGQTATYPLSISPISGFTGTVALTCSGAPQGGTCVVTPGSISMTNSSMAPFTVDVMTTAHTSAAAIVPTWGRFGTSMLFCSFGVLGAFCFGSPRQLMAILKRLWFVVTLASVIGLTACGGGNSAASFSRTGTPAGTYTVVVTATSGSTTHTQNLVLTVQ
jgi:Big-like domain-containing protein/VCBS repeat protein/FG-GAP repeat protein